MAQRSSAHAIEGGNISSQAITRACDMCRKKKIRCEPTDKSCFQCTKYGTDCHFTPIQNKRKPRRSLGHKHVEELERRLRSMEALLESPGRINRGRIEQVSQSGFGRLGLKRKAASQELGGSDRSYRSGPTMGTTLETPKHGIAERSSGIEDLNTSLETESSSFFALEDQAIHPMSLVSEELLSGQFNDHQVSITDSKHNALSNETLFSRRIFKHLPPKAEALLLINEAFHSFNAAFPIFDPVSFMHTFHGSYSTSSYDDPSWWASLNVVLALAHRFRAMRTLNSEAEDREAWGYLQNALAVVTELTMLHTNLFAVQALLGMAIVLQGTPNPRPCSALTAATIRLAQTMGLHRKNKDPYISNNEKEQRKRVFWIAYILDKDISLRTGQPPAQDDDDMDVDLPAETIDIVAQPRNGRYLVDFFYPRIGLAIIQGQIYKRLCSLKASAQSDEERMVAVQELDAMLLTWRSSVPIDFEAEYFQMAGQPIMLPALLHTIIIRFTYFNSLNTIHSPSRSPSYCPGTSCQSQSQTQSIGPNISFQCGNISSDPLCVEEARRAIQLVQITPQGDYACVWILVYFFVSAITTLLRNILISPSHSLAKFDLELIRPLLELLELLATEGKSEDVIKMHKYVEGLARQAREAVDNVERERSEESGIGTCPMETMKRNGGERESVEEFLMRIECISANCGVVNDLALADPDFGAPELNEAILI